MIELTKKQFDYFINRIRLSHYDFENLTPTQIMEGLVIAKYHLQIGVSNLIVNSNYTNQDAIYLCHPNNFTFNNVASYNDYIYLNITSAGFTANNGKLYFTPNASLYPGTNGYFDGIIVYFDGNVNHTGLPVFDFTDTNIKSIDYVGNKWGQINFNGNTPYLEEVNLSNDTRSLNVKYGEYDSNSSLPPSFFNGNTVREISFAPKAFAGSPIKKMVLPETGENYIIPESCFEGCTQLLEVVIPDCVTAIGKNAFKKCTNLEYVYIPDTVISIADGAFEECTSEYLNFEVSQGNQYFFGMHGALLRKKQDKTYSIIHGSTIGIQNYTTPYIDSSDWPSFITTQMPISCGMVKKTGGNRIIKDIHGNVITSTGTFISYANVSSRRQLDGGVIGNNYVIPIFYAITEIESRAFINDPNITYFDFRDIYGESTGMYWASLNTIGSEAFKGCKASVNLPYGYGDFNNRCYSFISSLTIGNSAFEESDVMSIEVYCPTTFGTKAYFNCSRLTTIDFGDYPPVNVTSEIGQLCFGNTPNLETITCNNITPTESGHDYVNTVRFNAIVNQSGPTSVDRGIYVGCKNTVLDDWMGASLFRVLDYAFYGCTTFTSDSVGYLYYIGNYAFYGCTGLVSTPSNPIVFTEFCQIGNKAFYGCTGIEYFSIQYVHPQPITSAVSIGDMAFANCGISEIDIDYNNIPMLAENAFDGCPLQTVNIVDNGSANTIVLGSNENVTNAVMTYINSASVSLLKSGNGKDIVNTVWTATTQDKNIVKICDNAFASSNMNSGNNRMIHIPQTVQYVGKTILKGSKANNLIDGGQTNTCSLQLDGVVYNSITGIMNASGVNSIGLLFYVGGRYFQKIVEDTDILRQQGKHYYKVNVDTTHSRLQIVEGKSDIVIAEIYYSNSHDIVITMYYKLNYDYMANDSEPHLNSLTTPITLLLMWNGESFSDAQQAIYCNAATAPGLTWNGISIPNDVEIQVKKLTYGAYTTISDGAFSDCKWTHSVRSYRLLTNATNVFKDCTNLDFIISMENDSSSINLPIFEGSIPSGAFNGCTNFRYFDNNGGNMRYPIQFNANAFKDCTSFSEPSEMLALGVNFAEGSFENTANTNIHLNSVCSLHPKAFKGVDRLEATADSICGYYFTGADEASIVNNTGVIVLGSKNSDIQYSKGVGPFSFYGLNINRDIVIEGSVNFSIGEEAFSTSTIRSYTESGCSGTSVGKGAFKKCNNLVRIEFNDNVSLQESAFESCINLNEVRLPRCIIPVNAFKGCTSLPNITISNSVDENAFNGCTSLREVNFSYGTGAINIMIKPSAFIGCPISVIGWTNDTNNYWYDNGCIYTHDEDTGHIKVVIGTKAFTVDNINTKIIGEHAFDGRGLSTIVIPGGVTRIEDYAFANNPYLTEAYIPATVEYIGKGAFDGCTNLVRMTLPDSCEYVGEGAFKGCSLTEGFNCNSTDSRYTTNQTINVTAITGSSSYTKFKSSLDLRKVYWAQRIGASAFSGTQIKSIWLPEKCTLVGNSAFYNCLYLVELHITADVANSFDDLAFYGCCNLGEIYLHHKIVPTVQDNQNALYKVGDYVPSGYKHLHVVSGFENNPILTTSVFYKKLVTDGGFTVIGDLDEQYI